MSPGCTCLLVLALAGAPDIAASAANAQPAAAPTTQRVGASAWLRKGEAAAAQIRNRDTRSYAQSQLVRAMADAGELQAAADLAERIEEGASRAGARAHLAAAQLKAGNMEAARRTLRQA